MELRERSGSEWKGGNCGFLLEAQPRASLVPSGTRSPRPVPAAALSAFAISPREELGGGCWAGMAPARAGVTLSLCPRCQGRCRSTAQGTEALPALLPALCSKFQHPLSRQPHPALPCPSLPLPISRVWVPRAGPSRILGLCQLWGVGCRVSGRDSPVPFCSTAQQTRLLKPIPSAECWALLTVQHCPKLPGLKGFNPKQSLPNSFCSRSSISWARATHRVTGITSPCSQH